MSETPHNPEQAMEMPSEKEPIQETTGNKKHEAEKLALQKETQEVVDTELAEKLRESLALNAELANLHEDLKILVEEMNERDKKNHPKDLWLIDKNILYWMKNIFTRGRHGNEAIQDVEKSKDFEYARDAIRNEIKSVLRQLESIEGDGQGTPLEQFKEARANREKLYGKGGPKSWGKTLSEEEAAHRADMRETESLQEGLPGESHTDPLDEYMESKR